MEVSHKSRERKRRYIRRPMDSVLSITPIRLKLLTYVADYGIVSLPQLARLACPSEKSARRHMRELFDGGLVSIVPVPRAALPDDHAENDASLLFGSAPNIYTLTRNGLRVLREGGFDQESRLITDYGPRNSLFLAHELAIRDVRVWLEVCARERNGDQVERWNESAAAVIEIGGSHRKVVVRPDAWFVYSLGQQVLVGLVEVDRGTERGALRWGEKLRAYETLFRPGAVKAATGYANARILVVCPNARRVEWLAQFIRSHGSPALHDRFWLAEQTMLRNLSLTAPAWRRIGDTNRQALIPSPTSPPPSDSP